MLISRISILDPCYKSLENVETCVINIITQNLYFGFCQTFQPNECVDDDVNRN